MKLYEECIKKVVELLEPFKAKSYDLSAFENWPDEGKNQMIFQSDMAYELGGGTHAALSGIIVTESREWVPCDEVLLYGQDINELKTDTAYARIAIVRIGNSEHLDSNSLHQLIRRIDYTRYHINPKGYMMRISAMNRREPVRIGKAEIKDGLSFGSAGTLFLKSYHKHPEVEAVKLIYVTLPEFPYGEVDKWLQKSEDITKTLDHLAKKVQMDCHACSLKEVCEEVETMYAKDKK